MTQRGLTLLELLISLVILSLILALAIPSFQSQTQQIRTKTTALSLYEAIQATRTRAVSTNGRATLRARGDWSRGWELFDDLNHNGVRDAGEPLILEHGMEGTDIHISGNGPVASYVSYLGTGESRYANGNPRGGFQAGTITICAETGGYQLVLARMGRLRKQAIGPEDCLEKLPEGR